MYKSPIELIITEIEHKIVQEQEEEIYKAVVHYVPNVDKEELIRALKYDRDQYDAGYKDGQADVPHCATEAVYKSGYEDGKPKWIPVAERLPEVVGTYIVAVKFKYDWEKEYTIEADVAVYDPYSDNPYIDGCWNAYIDWDEGQQYIHITHWMPLPEPPKGE